MPGRSRRLRSLLPSSVFAAAIALMLWSMTLPVDTARQRAFLMSDDELFDAAASPATTDLKIALVDELAVRLKRKIDQLQVLTGARDKKIRVAAEDALDEIYERLDSAARPPLDPHPPK